jgi:parvulin-like peptidyl-prolyl isomerase
MMTKLREFSTTFLIILVLAFVGMMVFEWGMDYSGMSRGQNVVGEVNGDKLTYEQFQEFYQQLFQSEKQRSDQNFDENKLKTLRDQVWEQFVQRTLFSEEMKKLNISVSDSEIVYQITNYPLEEIKNNPGFQTDGVFDMNKYRQSFSNPDIPWYQIEDFYRQQLPFVKIQNIITSSVRVSESEIEDEYLKQNQTVKVEFLEFPFSKFNTNELEITDEEVKQYYDEHIEDYHQKEKRKLSYVLFPLIPTKADTDRTMRTFDEIRQRYANGEDFNSLADEYSEDPAVTQNHGRYEFFERGAMVKPFEEAAFNGKKGEFVGPVKTQYGYHLILIEDKRIEKGKEQAQVSHILVSVTTGPSTRELMADKAALFAEDAATEGFTKIAESNDYTIEETVEFAEEGSFIPGFGRHFGIVNFAFTGNLDDVSDYMETDKGFAVFMLTGINPEGAKPLEEVKAIVTSRTKLDKAKEKGKEFATGFETKIKGELNWINIAQSDESKIIRFDSTTAFKLNTSVPKIGNNPDFNATALSLNKDQVSDIVETNRGLYYMRLLEKSEYDSVNFNQQYSQIKNRLLSQKRNQVFQEWYEYLKEKADIVDNRKMFNL